MATGTTLLSYEMSWQLKLFELMTNSQQANDYLMACIYGEAFLHIIGLKDKIPERKIPEKSGGRDEVATLQRYFQQLLMTGITKIGDNIQAVRNDPRYRREGVVPSYTKQKEPAHV